jgi:hypothetical protein
MAVVTGNILHMWRYGIDSMKYRNRVTHLRQVCGDVPAVSAGLP